MKRTRREALDTARHSLAAVVAACDGAGYGHITLCPETMGKINQLGDLDEVLELCQVDERLLPTVDFGHLYARSLGEAEGEEATEAILDRMAAAGVKNVSLSNFDVLAEVAAEEGYIRPEEVAKLRVFRDDPNDSRWMDL